MAMTFHVRIEGGAENILTLQTDDFCLAAIAAVAMHGDDDDAYVTIWTEATAKEPFIYWVKPSDGGGYESSPIRGHR